MDPAIKAAYIGGAFTVIAAVLGVYLARQRTRKPRPLLREASAAQLAVQIEKAPPLHRATLARSVYVGRWVKWRGTVASVNLWRFALAYVVQVVARERALRDPSVFLRFPIWARERVEHLRPGDSIEYEGRIASIDPISITLRRVKILMHQPAPSPDQRAT
jgi:hypothetical protein